jgi:hypothetical protein
MERRRQTRVEVPLNGKLAQPERKIEAHCQVLDLSQNGMRLKLREPLLESEGVKVEVADCMFLGEVMWVKPCSDGFEVGLEIVHVLNCISRLGEELARYDKPQRSLALDDLPKPIPKHRPGDFKPLLDSAPMVVRRR